MVNRLVQWLAGQSRQLEERPMGCAEEWRAANRRWQVRAGQKGAAWRGVTQNGSDFFFFFRDTERASVQAPSLLTDGIDTASLRHVRRAREN